ncbi:MAG: glycosyltransferase [Deltaproteobacteria bacterium]|nr:glycosyltransferase [Deltaproteobacteria bacterium]
MKVLALTKYDDSVASSRQRFAQFFPDLAAAGALVQALPLWPRAHVDRLFAGQRFDPHAERVAYGRRWRQLHDVVDADVWWIEGELLPFFPAAWEPRPPARVRVVVDLDDAVFHKYDLHASRLVRSILGSKIDLVMAAADVVVAGNAYVAARARAAGARHVDVVPTVVDLALLPPASVRAPHPFTIGWIGTPHTAQYLRSIEPALARLVDEGAALRLVGLAHNPLRVRATCVPWRRETEATELARFDVGIMPLRDSPWERGKCGYKLIQCMAVGTPVVASDVGVNVDVVGDAGFVVAPDGWTAALRRLRDDEDLRAAQGRRGRERVARFYSRDAVAHRVVRAVLG